MTRLCYPLLDPINSLQPADGDFLVDVICQMALPLLQVWSISFCPANPYPPSPAKLKPPPILEHGLVDDPIGNNDRQDRRGLPSPSREAK